MYTMLHKDSWVYCIEKLGKSFSALTHVEPNAEYASLRLHLATAVLSAEEPLVQASCGERFCISHSAILPICLLINL